MGELDNNQEEKKVLNETMTVEISKDKMIAIVLFQIPLADNNSVVKRLKPADIDAEIKKAGIEFGIDREVLEKIYKIRLGGHKYIIAQGEAPTPGTDAELFFEINVEDLKNRKPKEKHDGTVDLKDLEAAKNVRVGEVLVRKIPLIEGQNGTNVLGKEIKAPRAKDKRLPKGKNTKISEDGLMLLAEIEGQVAYDGHSVTVSPVFTVDGDVDNSVGDINFIGSVVVSGVVKSGFTINAKGNVEVRGVVEDATIISGGDVILQKGLQATGKGKIIAEGNVFAKYIQNGNVEAGRDVVSEAILHSTIEANGNVIVENGRGTIVGGRVSAGNMISALTIGSPMSTPTELHLGILKEVVHEFTELDDKFREIKTEIDRLTLSISFLEGKNRENQLPPTKVTLLEKLMETRRITYMRFKEIADEHARLKQIIDQQQDGIIKSKKIIYPGSKIVMGKAVYFVTEEYTFCSFRKEKEEIRVGMY